MKRKFWQTERFKELQRKWNEKLRDSGFIDAERDGKLIQNSANSYRTQIREVIENKQRYFELLGQWYHEEMFTNSVHNFVMRRRSEGISQKQISRELRDIGEINSHETVRKIIRYYEYKWQIKTKKKP